MGIYSHEENAILHPASVVTEVSYHDTIFHALHDRRVIFDTALSELGARAEILTEVAKRLVETLRSGHKVLIMGNGGSAAEAQHFAAELVGRFKHERSPYAAISLTTDTAILTAVANDYSYQEVFARQVLALGQPGDMLIAYSTSGESENLLRAVAAARRNRMTTVAITGDRPCSLSYVVDMAVHVPVVDTAMAQELHMVVTHVLCEIVESQLMLCEGEVCQ